jgi:hypothetical protein
LDQESALEKAVSDFEIVNNKFAECAKKLSFAEGRVLELTAVNYRMRQVNPP